MPHQTTALAELMAQKRFDAVIVDYGFFGIMPFLLGDRAARPSAPPYSTTPLMLSSRDTAPPAWVCRRRPPGREGFATGR